MREDSLEYLTDSESDAMPPYSSYRYSGVDCLGEVPAHWEVRRLKNWLGVNELVLPEGTDPEYTFDYVDIGSIETGRLTTAPERIRFGNAPSRARRVVRPGDTIVSTVRTYLKAVWYAEHPGVDLIASTGFAVLTPRRGTFPKFVSYLCQSAPFTDRITAESVGIAYPAISETNLRTFKVCVPPLSEQVAIVRFLDHVDRRIRRYVRAKHKLIAVLEEQKQVVIQQAVTGRIDVRTGQPYPKYKPSGVEWLGQVPASWQVWRSKRAFASRRELARPDDIQLSATQAYGVIAQEKYEKKVGRKVVRILRHLEQRQHVEIDDFVISMRSFQGGLERAWDTGCIRSSYIVLQPTTRLVVGYFGRLFKSTGYVAALRSTANFIRDGQDLNFENFCRVDLPFPPLEEQQKISVILDRTVAGIDFAIERWRRQIDLLDEYRTRLIADVVTGKLDVREAAAGLPDVDSAAVGDDGDPAEAPGVPDPERAADATERDATTDVMPDERNHPAGQEERA